MQLTRDSGQTLMFGGWAFPQPVVYQDTNLWDGTAWTLALPSFQPTERCEHLIAYDSLRQRVMLYGGQDFNFNQLQELLEWDGQNGTWTDVTPAIMPPWRQRGAMTFDSARGVLVLFGGETSPGVATNDIWEFDGTAWTQVFPSNPPTPRSGHDMAFSVALGKTVVCGGFDTVNQVTTDETWTWDGSTWQQLSTANTPSPRVDHRMTFHFPSAAVLMHGGRSSGPDALGETWEFDGRDWYRVFTATPAPALLEHAVAYDTLRQRTVAFGGRDSSFGTATADTWEYGGDIAAYRTFGAGCPGSNGLVPELNPVGTPGLGGAFVVEVLNLPAAVNLVYMGLGFSDTINGALALPANLTPFGLTGCTAYTSLESGFLVPNTGTQADWSVTIPNDPGLVGLDFFNQAYPIDQGLSSPRPLSASNAGRGTIR